MECILFVFIVQGGLCMQNWSKWNFMQIDICTSPGPREVFSLVDMMTVMSAEVSWFWSPCGAPMMGCPLWDEWMGLPVGIWVESEVWFSWACKGFDSEEAVTIQDLFAAKRKYQTWSLSKTRGWLRNVSKSPHKTSEFQFQIHFIFPHGNSKSSGRPHHISIRRTRDTPRIHYAHACMWHFSGCYGPRHAIVSSKRGRCDDASDSPKTSFASFWRMLWCCWHPTK